MRAVKGARFGPVLSLPPLTRTQVSFSLGKSLRAYFKIASRRLSTAFAFPHSSDSAVKQILLTMNERDNFIVEDLDDFHIIIKADEEYRVRKQLELEVRRDFSFMKWRSPFSQLEKNTYSLE
jgi:TFIIH basal transcription factor complex TTD-A subunit